MWSSIDGRAREAKPQQVGLQIPRCFHSEVPQKDAVRPIAEIPWGGIPKAGRAEGEPDRGGACDARSCSHDDLDPTEIRRFAGDWLHQGKERHTLGARVRGKSTQFRWSELLGARI